MPGTGEVQGTLAITLFDRDRSGERRELENRVRLVEAQVNDLAREIEQELQKAVLDLRSTSEQVKVTQAALELAGRELELARDRFSNGVADNIEVVVAQDALSSAQNDRLGALARHADARMALIRALGGGEKNYQMYLEGR
jgi:outer membrane protein TolC